MIQSDGNFLTYNALNFAWRIHFVFKRKLFLLRGKLLLWKRPNVNRTQNLSKKWAIKGRDNNLAKYQPFFTSFSNYRHIQNISHFYSNPNWISLWDSRVRCSKGEEKTFPLEKLVQFWSLLLHECIYFPKVTWICFSQTFELFFIFCYFRSSSFKCSFDDEFSSDGRASKKSWVG